MKISNRIVVLASMLILGLASCSLEAPERDSDRGSKVPEVTADVLEGELLVRFDSRVAEILDKAGLTKSGPGKSMTRSGILSVDEILDLVDGYQIERVFPVDVRSEEKARNEGLHLSDCMVFQIIFHPCIFLFLKRLPRKPVTPCLRQHDFCRRHTPRLS